MKTYLLAYVSCIIVVCTFYGTSFAQGTIQRQVKISNANGNIVTLQTDTPTTSYTLSLPNNPNPSLTTASLLYGVGDGNMAWSSTVGADSGNFMMLTRIGSRLVPSWTSMSTAGFVNNGEPILTFSADNGSLTNNRVFSVGTGLSITNSGADNGSLVVGNTGVLKLTAGSGISLSDSTGNIVISSSSSYASGSGTATRLAFWGPGPGVTTNLQDDSSLYWDNTNKRLSIGAGPSPTSTIHTVTTGSTTANTSAMSIENTATSSSNSVNKAGLLIQSTGSWTGTGSANIGLAVNATGGTTNYAALLNGGNVGIGVSTPSQLLEMRNGNLLLSNNNGTAGGLQLQGTGTGTTTLVAGAQGTTDITLTLPTALPTANGQVLSSSTTGTLSWITPGGGGGLTGSGTATRIAFWGPGPGATTNLMDDASLYWDNTNKRLGIGTISPSSSIDVSDGSLRISNTTGTAGQLRLQGTGAGITTFQAGAQGATDLNYTLPTAYPTANGQALTATTAGVLSWASVSGGSSDGWLLTGNAGTAAATNFLGTTDSVDLILRTNNSRRMIVKADGDVGIGVPSPNSLLHVRETDVATSTRSNVLTIDHNTSGTTAAGFGSNILFQLQSTAALAATGSMRDAASIGVQWTTATDASRSAAMIFSTVDTGSSLKERVRIASNGYVGINNANPVTSMDINGAYATKQTTLTLSNGRNDNIAIGNSSFVRIVGPTGAFSISGIAAGTNGKRVRIANMTGQDWTIMDSSTYSSLGNRIETNTNSDILVRGPVPVLDMIYDSVSNQWLLGTLNANQIIGSIGSIVYVYKTADESVTSSATIQDDDHLSFTLNANETWELNGEIQVDNASNNIDIKCAFQMPTGSTMRIYVTGIQDAGGNAIQGNGLLTVSNTPKTIQINGGVSTLVSFRGIIQTGSTSGALKFRWSQGVSNTSTTTVRAYSYMKIIRVK